MKTQKIIAAVAASLALGAFGSAYAANESADDAVLNLFKFAAIDMNKDGMVSKQEFMDMASKAWDMKAKDMKLKGGMMTEADYKKWMDAFLSRGNRN